MNVSYYGIYPGKCAGVASNYSNMYCRPNCLSGSCTNFWLAEHFKRSNEMVRKRSQQMNAISISQGGPHIVSMIEATHLVLSANHVTPELKSCGVLVMHLQWWVTAIPLMAVGKTSHSQPCGYSAIGGLPCISWISLSESWNVTYKLNNIAWLECIKVNCTPAVSSSVSCQQIDRSWFFANHCSKLNIAVQLRVTFFKYEDKVKNPKYFEN